MSDERSGLKQNITAGDGSQNFQAARDVNVHNHAASPTAQSSIHRPTNAQIAALDPKTAKIIHEARLRLEPKMVTVNAAGRLAIFFLFVLAAALIVVAGAGFVIGLHSMFGH